MKGIDASLIFHRTGVSESEYAGNLNEIIPDPSECIILQPGVNLNSKGKVLEGPIPERDNRMTLEEYQLICQTNQNDKIRYIKPTDSQDINEDGSIRIKDSSNFEEKIEPLIRISKFKRPKTGKDKSRIIGNVQNALILQNTIMSKKVNFQSSRSRVVLNAGMRRSSTRNDFATLPVKAKEFYESQQKIKEAVIKYNNLDEAQPISEKSRLLNASRSSKTLRPSTAFKTKGPIIPSQAISAFDKFNRDIINHRVSNESVKRLQPKSAMLKQKRIMSARKKASDMPLKSTFARQRVPSAKQLPSAISSKTKNSFAQQLGIKKDSMINVKIETI